MKFPRLLICMFLLTSCSLGNFTGEMERAGERLTLAYAESYSTLSPLSYEAKNRNFLSNVYEPLVRYDSNFNFETGLAVSWGRLDDKTWDFHIRDDVYFHDGSLLDADDVLYSLELARTDSFSDLQSLLSTIDSVEKTESNRIQIHTNKPDPLLLNKLTYVYMIPDAYMAFDLPIGTGPYRVSEFKKDGLLLERFAEYWGPLAYFREVYLQVIPDPAKRQSALLSGSIEILADVPPQSVNAIRAAAFDLESYPSLEVSFLMLNTNGPFADPVLRSIVHAALSSDYAEGLGGGFLLNSSQYAAKGIFGYFSDLKVRERDLETALTERARYSADLRLTLDVPEGLAALGERIQTDLAEVDIQVTVQVYSSTDFENQILSGNSDFFFFGWKYDLADSADFFAAVMHSQDEKYGQFNGTGYANEAVDTLIEEVSTTMDLATRKLLLREITELILEDKVAIPLFESQVLYAIDPVYYFDSRLDGQIWASEVVENVLE